MTVELYHQNYFFYRITVLMSSTYVSVLIYVCCCFQILCASVNVSNCKSVAGLVSFLSSYLLFCWWNCVEIGMSDITSCLVFVFSEICLSWVGVCIAALCDLISSACFTVWRYNWCFSNVPGFQIGFLNSQFDLSCKRRYCCIWLSDLKLLNESPLCRYELEHKGIILTDKNKSPGKCGVLFILL